MSASPALEAQADRLGALIDSIMVRLGIETITCTRCQIVRSTEDMHCKRTADGVELRCVYSDRSTSSPHQRQGAR